MAFANAVVTPAVALAVLLAAASATAAEGYRYTARAQGGEGGAERHVVRIETTAGGSVYRFTVARDDETEEGAITTAGAGAFVSAWRIVERGGGDRVETDSLWVSEGTLWARRQRGSKASVKEISLPSDRPLAVDASMLVWMRAFPFGGGAERDVFMADWSQRTVNVTVRDLGVETVDVPAGVFACHRVEVVVKVLIFRPKITFWIAVESPHFLVKHAGKRGPFTPTFVTTLTHIEAEP